MDRAIALDRYDERDWERSDGGTVRFALVGLGWWTSDIVLPALAEADYCEPTVLVSGDGQKAARLAEERDVDAGIDYDAYHEGERQDDYDAVYVSTPNATHLEYVETAAALGTDVLCEKPLEARVERGERLVRAVEEAGVTLMTAYRMQTDPAVRRARELVQGGAIGEPVQARGGNAQPLLEMNPDPDQWRLDPELSGYGTSVMDLGIYPINTARFLLGEDPVSARASMRSPSDEFGDVPDEYATFTLEFPSGVSLSCTTSQNAQRESHLTILGTEGRLVLDPAFHGRPILRLRQDDTMTTVEAREFDLEAEMREEFDYFADRLLAGDEVHPTGRHGLTDLRIIAAIHEAAGENESVDIDRE